MLNCGGRLFQTMCFNQENTLFHTSEINYITYDLTENNLRSGDFLLNRSRVPWIIIFNVQQQTGNARILEHDWKKSSSEVW
jgi:thiol:disulfide interchange protein